MPFEDSARLIAGRYRVGKLLHNGSGGSVFDGKDTTKSCGEDDVVIKLDSTGRGRLASEHSVYRDLWLHSRCLGIPKVYCFEPSADDFGDDSLVLERLGPDLEMLFNFFERRLSSKTCLMLAFQLLSRVEFIHSIGLIHGSIKPANFVMGMYRRANLVYMIDFGRSKYFKWPATDTHAKYAENLRWSGNPQWASANAHLGIRTSRRDDLESLGYMLIYFFCQGRLPWTYNWRMRFSKSRNAPYYPSILDKKLACVDQNLVPQYPELQQFLKCARELKFDQDPDYNKFRGLLTDLFTRQGHVHDYCFDWLIRKFGDPAASKSTSTKSLPESSKSAQTVTGSAVEPERAASTQVVGDSEQATNTEPSSKVAQGPATSGDRE